MAIPAIPKMMLPVKIGYQVSYYVRRGLERRKLRKTREGGGNGDSGTSSEGQRRGMFDMGHYLHLTKPAGDFTKEITSQIKSHLKDVKPNLAGLKLFYSRLARSRSHAQSQYTDSDQPSASSKAPRLGGMNDISSLNTLPSSILLKIFKDVPITTLPALLRVNKSFRKLVLENYHLILSYPRAITSKYEFCPLTLPFPDWFGAVENGSDRNRGYTSDTSRKICQFFDAWWRVRMYQDCYKVLAEVLANEYISYWEVSATRNPRFRETYEEVRDIGCDGLKQLILIALVKESLDRGVSGDVSEYLESLVDEGFGKESYEEEVEYEGKGKGKGKAKEVTREGEVSLNQNLFKGFSSDNTTDPEHTHIQPTEILKKSLTHTIHKTVLEEISYSFPEVELEELHPVQLLELLVVKIPPWSWSQEDEVERLRRMFVMSPKSRQDIERYRGEWEEMRTVVEGVVRAGVL
ncbi:hypothetical protein TWF506_004106 [Arthrobotrys conoides]|uniref:F-box domain-containing protein n=1 Tax=Arthrobotrys conoides TaxID=74498 RepID=A0AAN8RPY3_9PEZI